jgi:hypothetical protein
LFFILSATSSDVPIEIDENLLAKIDLAALLPSTGLYKRFSGKCEETKSIFSPDLAVAVAIAKLNVLNSKIDSLTLLFKNFFIENPPKHVEQDLFKKAEALVQHNIKLPLDKTSQISALNEALGDNKLAAALVNAFTQQFSTTN